MSRTVNMTRGNPLKLLFSFAIPLMFGNAFQQLYTLVDVAVIGRGVGMQALAALGTVDWLNWMFLGIASGFTQGFAVKISQKYGENDLAELRRTVARSAFLSVILAVAGTAVAQIGLPWFMMLLRVPENLVPMAALYSRIIMGGFPAVVFFNYCSSVLRGIGDSKTPLVAMTVAAVTNIGLDLVAVFLLRWGIAGAGAATVFSQFLSGMICMIRILRTPELHFSGKDLAESRVQTGTLMKLGMPIAAKNMLVALGGMGVQTVVNGFDMSFIAGYTATNKLYGLLEIAALSYGYSVTTYVGQNFGASRLDRIRKGVRCAVVLSLITSVIISAVMFLFGRQITGMFLSTEDPSLAAAAGETAYVYLCFMASCLPVLYLLYVYQSALQGIGNTASSMVGGILETVVRVGISVVVGYTGHATGVFSAEVGAWIVCAVFLMITYYCALRKLRDVAPSAPSPNILEENAPK